MGLTLEKLNSVLASGLLGLFLFAVAPAIAASESEPVSYVQMSDAELNEALKGWSTLESVNRRGLLVEIKRRMENPKQPQTLVLGANKQMPSFTVHIRVQQTRKFGLSASGQPVDRQSDRSTGGVLVIHGEFAPTGKEAAGEKASQQSLPQFISLRPLRGPDFGRGFEQRQAFYRVAEVDQPDAEESALEPSEVSESAQTPDSDEADQRER